MSVYYPEIIDKALKHEGESIVLVLEVVFPQELIYFSGHFHEKSILPGIAQVNLAIQYASDILFLPKDNIGTLKQVKFTKLITPQTTLQLSIILKENQLEFTYASERGAYSMGIIALKHNINILHSKARIGL